jgi:hypothetical protein
VTGLLPPSDPRAPKFWRHETGGLLAPAMERFLLHKRAKPGDTDLIRAYLQQWIDSPVWQMNPAGSDYETHRALTELRQSAHSIHTRDDVRRWVAEALDLGIDPL